MEEDDNKFYSIDGPESDSNGNEKNINQNN